MIGGGGGQGARDKSRVLKAKAAQDVPSATAAQVPCASVQDDASADPTADGPSKALDDAKSAPRYFLFSYFGLKYYELILLK